MYLCFNKTVINFDENETENETQITQIRHINKSRPRNGHKYIKHKTCLSMMIVCTKQHLSNMWSSIYEKVKQHWGWVEKKALLIKKFLLL